MSRPADAIVQLRTSEGVLILSVASGQLASVEAVACFERELRRALREREERCWLIDFGNTTFFITPAINTLLAVLRTLRERGGKLVLTGVNQDVHYVLGLMRVDRVLIISPTIAAGLQEFGQSDRRPDLAGTAEAG